MSNAGTGMGAVYYLGSRRNIVPRVGRLGKISVHFLSKSEKTLSNRWPSYVSQDLANPSSITLY